VIHSTATTHATQQTFGTLSPPNKYSGGVFSNVVNDDSVIDCGVDLLRTLAVPKSPSFTTMSHRNSLDEPNTPPVPYLMITVQHTVKQDTHWKHRGCHSLDVTGGVANHHEVQQLNVTVQHVKVPSRRVHRCRHLSHKRNDAMREWVHASNQPCFPSNHIAF
jgi:hypothetical protein